MLNLLKLQSVLYIETLSPRQEIFDKLTKAFENDLLFTPKDVFAGTYTYRKIQDTPFIVYGPLGAKSMPLLSKINIYEKDNKVVIEIYSSLLKALMVDRLIFSFFVCLCLITLMAVLLLKVHIASLVLAPLIFWLFGMWVLQPEAQYTKKAIEAVILGE